MDIREEEGALVIETTNEKLAQRIGTRSTRPTTATSITGGRTPTTWSASTGSAS